MSNITFKIESWDDWDHFLKLTWELFLVRNDLRHPNMLEPLVERMRTHKILVHCQECGWTGPQDETIKGPFGPLPMRCPQCKKCSGHNGDGFEAVPITFEINLADLAPAPDEEPEPDDYGDHLPDWAEHHSNWGDYAAAEYPKVFKGGQ